MRARATPLAIAVVSLAGLGACDAPTPTEPAAPAIQTVRANASIANNGIGAQFEPIYGPDNLLGFFDAAGSFCNVAFSAQEGSKTRNDFWRYNKDGSVSIHTSDQAAVMDLLVNGKVYTGVGHAQASATMSPGGTTWEQFVMNATGEVRDPSGETHVARCSARGHDTASLQGTIRVMN
jgi:hypothetical protein